MRSNNLKAKLYILSAFILSFIYVMLFFFFPDIKIFITNKILKAMTLIYSGPLVVGVFCYEFNFENIESQLGYFSKGVLLCLYAILTIFTYLLFILLKPTYVNILYPKFNFIFFVYHILFMIVGLLLICVLGSISKFHFSFDYYIFQVLIAKFAFMLSILPLFKDINAYLHLLLIFIKDGKII